MQDGILNPPHWLQLVLAAVASLVARDGIVKLYHIWLNRNKPAAEIHRTREEATEIRVRSSSAAGDAVIRFMDRLTVAQETIDRLRDERDAWEQQYGEVFTEKVRIQRENEKLLGENESYEKQIKRMQRTLAENGWNYDNTQDIPVGPLDN